MHWLKARALASTCNACGHVAFPARTTCLRCAGDQINWTELPGTARVLFRTDGPTGSFALVRFDGADTNSTVALGNTAGGHSETGTTQAQKSSASTLRGRLIAPPGERPGLWLALTNSYDEKQQREQAAAQRQQEQRKNNRQTTTTATATTARTTMSPDMFNNWTAESLSDIGLVRAGEGVKINIPVDANLYHMSVGAQLEAGRHEAPALIFETPDGTLEHWSFGDVDAQASALAHELRQRGYGRGDLIGLHTGMRPETAIAHMAVCKLGGTAVTLSQLYGPDALAHALNHCELRCLLSTESAWNPLRDGAAAKFPHLKDVLVSGSEGDEPDLTAVLRASAPADFKPEYTAADDPALLMYTSGSTGMPKGILHGHRVLASYRPSISLFFNLSMHDEDAVFWSPSDWAWVGGLLDMVFPAWMAGRPIVTSEARFKADWAYDFMARHKVTHTFLAPTAIKRLAETPNPRDDFDLSLRVICTGGEALAAETLSWAETRLGVVCNEFYGMTEVNHLIGNCASLYPRRPGSMGVAYPGHQVLLVDDEGKDVPVGEQGEIVTPATAPTRYLGYLKNAEKEAELRLGDFMRTHDLAVRDADGYFWYKGRSDDLIKSSGFRIGPAEIEECLLAHSAVAEVGVIGKPDAERGSIVKAFIRLAANTTGDEALSDELKEHVRTRLAAYKAPREIAYVSDFEMTSSGKINRRVLRASEA